MDRLFVTRQGSRVNVKASRFQIQTTVDTLSSLPSKRVEALYTFGNVQVTTQATRDLLGRAGVIAGFSRHGRLWGVWQGPGRRGGNLRLKQSDIQRDSAKRITLARAHVRARVKSLAEVFRNRGAADLGILRDEFYEEHEQAQQRIASAAGFDELRGIEGSITRRYFELLPQLVSKEGWSVGGRSRRPPRDPLNALLSLGYSLLYAEFEGLVTAEGLEPTWGHLHVSRNDSTALVFDLVDEFRAKAVDQFVVTSIQSGIFQLNQFANHSHQGVFLKKDAMKTFLSAWDKHVLADDGYVDTNPHGQRREWFQAVRQLAARINSMGEDA
ncbi:CRISPR-associated endonuclease Cas1 [bacterium]|nr:CRISPR-associated endonuclease Cas1 [bacterium]